MEKSNIDEIQKYAKSLKNKDLKFLFLHYRKIIDNINLNTLSNCQWFFVLKAELIDRNIDVVKMDNVNKKGMTL
jgi:hypothetical protein